MNTRARVSTVRLPPNPPISPPVINAPIPVRNTRRAPNTSQSFPAVGCAIAEAKYSAETRGAAADGDTHRSRDRHDRRRNQRTIDRIKRSAHKQRHTKSPPEPTGPSSSPTRLRSINALRQSGRPVSQAAMMLNKLQHSDFEIEASYLGPRQHRTDIAQHRVELPTHHSLAESHKNTVSHADPKATRQPYFIKHD